MPVPLRVIRVGVALRLRFVLAFLAAILCATAIVQARPALASRITGWRSARAPSTDTIPVFGPKRFEATGSRAAYYVERFSTSASFGTRYLLRVQSGETNGTGRPTRGGVLVNGATVISAEEIARGGAFLKPVDLQGQNALEVTLEGAAGAGITVWVLQVPDPTFTVVPPRRFIRGTGEPFVERVRFRMVPSAGPPFLLHVANGNADGTRRVASATLWVNGTAAVGASEFTQQVAGLVRPVALSEDNSVEVEVRSQPGSFVTVWLTATDTAAPVLEILAPAPALVSKLATVDVSGRVQDATVTQVSVNGVVAARSGDGFTANVPLAVEGPNTLRIRAIDAAGNRTDSVRTVIRDTEAPRITLTSPAEGAAGRDSMVHVVGTIQDRTAVTANVNGVPLTLTAAGAFEADVAAQEGVNFVTIAATDAAGNTSTLVRQTTRDLSAPQLILSAPAEGLITPQTSLQVQGTATDASAVVVKVNGLPIPRDASGSFIGTAALSTEGGNTLTVEATDAAGNVSRIERHLIRDTQRPTLAIGIPADGTVTNQRQVEVTGTVSDSTSVVVSVSGLPAVVSNGHYSVVVPLNSEGENALAVTATDAAGNQSTTTRVVIRDTEQPQLTILAPVSGFVTKSQTVLVTGTAVDRSTVTVKVNGSALTVQAEGTFAGEIPLLAEGTNALTVVAADAAGNESSSMVAVRRDTEAPVITIIAPAEGTSTLSTSVSFSGTVVDASPVVLSLNGIEIPVANGGGFAADVPLTEGANSLVLLARDAAGNTSTGIRSVSRTIVSPLPPDPATIAPVIDMSVPTTAFTATQFIYSGAHPIQTGAVVDSINPLRTALVRGKVSTRAGGPLPGVRVSILDHPEFGETLTRADGRFDLVINGGGAVTLTYSKGGFFSAQRRLTPEWQEYSFAPDVVLLQPDPAATHVDLTTPVWHMAPGGLSQDGDGARRATVFIRAGTSAVLQMPDGTSQAVQSLTLRSTEATVGPSGAAAMPASLPPSSAYTYAVNITADEGLAAGAEHVQFSKPTPIYVENFLHFPVGSLVPAGYYDETRAVWVPMDNGLVIRILSIASGLAEIDVDGDGRADTPDRLAALGIDADERTALAAQYPAGASLWRVTTTHLSWFDFNWPSAVVRNGLAIEVVKAIVERMPDCERTTPGSIIGCNSQVLGERLDLTGSDLTLNYRTSRVPGRTTANVLRLKLLGDTVPPTLTRVDVEIEIAGQLIRKTLAPMPGLELTWTWDGRDGFGRVMQGSQRATVRVSMVSPAVYRVPAEIGRAFGMACMGVNSSGYSDCSFPAGAQVPLRTENVQTEILGAWLGAWDARAVGLGGWTLDVHHTYEPLRGVLHLGDGTDRHVEGMAAVLRNVPGMGGVLGLAYGPDGSAYATIDMPYNGAVVVRRARDGVITRIAGEGSPCSGGAANTCGDGGPALQAQLSFAGPITVAPDGTVYFVTGSRIRKLATDGTISTYAGGGAYGPPIASESVPGPQAYLGQVAGLAIGPDGSLYISDSGMQRIRRVFPDGLIRSVAGGGPPVPWSPGDEIPATTARIGSPGALALAADGTIYVADGIRVRSITTDGLIHTVAGCSVYMGLPCGPSGTDGQLATQVDVGTVSALALAPDGNLYLGMYWYVPVGAGTETRGLIKRVDPEGRLHTIAGDGGFIQRFVPTFEGSVATQVPVYASQVAVSPDGGVYFVQMGTMWQIAPGMPGLSLSEMAIPAADGTELYYFDSAGRHLRTVDALTQAVISRFSYSSATGTPTPASDGSAENATGLSAAHGVLASVIDAAGNVTRIERGLDGVAAGILAPFGQRSTLVASPEGFLSGVADPSGEKVSLGYKSQGLLSSLTSPSGGAHSFEYSVDGRLISDAAPGGWSKVIAEVPSVGASETSITTTLGTTETHRRETNSAGVETRTTVDSAGLSTREVHNPGGLVTIDYPDGTTEQYREGADPRFGTSAPMLMEGSVTLPSGLRMEAVHRRTVQLSRPGDPLTLAQQNDEWELNGKTYSEVYAATHRTSTSTSPEGRRRVTAFDSLGRMVSATLGNLTPTRYQYDETGRLRAVSRGGRQWAYDYDANGRVHRVTDPMLHSNTYTYDAAGQVETQTLADGNVIAFHHNADGNLRELIPPGSAAYTFDVDNSGLLRRFVRPSAGDTATARNFGYDANYRLTSVISSPGSGIAVAYDSAGRLSRVESAAGPVDYTYRAQTGTLASVTGPLGTLGYEFDGPLLTSVRSTGAVAGTVSFQYDASFHMVRERVNGDEVQFKYDGDGLLVGAGELVVSRDAETGVVTGSVLGSVVSTQQFDSLGELQSLAVRTSGGEPLFAKSFTRDKLGRITGVEEGVGAQALAYAYEYDAVGRLRQVRLNGAALVSYTYDANGNPLRVTTPNGVVSGTYDVQDRVRRYGEAVFGYAVSGELGWRAVGGDTTRYSFDALGRLSSVGQADGTSIEYLIDAQGRRVGRRENGSLIEGLLYEDDLRPIATVDSLGVVTSRFVYSEGTNVPEYMVRDGRTFRFVNDERGSVRLVVDAASGEVAQRVDYDAFGRVVADSRPGFQPFGYAGGIYDSRSGLVHFGERDYDPALGRWLSADPIGFAGGASNLYEYSLGDPINRQDPDGLQAIMPMPGPMGLPLPMPPLPPLPRPPRITTEDIRQGALAVTSRLLVGPIVLAMGKGGKQNHDNHWVDLARQMPDPCAWLKMQYNAAKGRERLAIKTAQKALGCRRNSQDDRCS